MTRQDWLKLHLDDWAHIRFERGAYNAFDNQGRWVFAQMDTTRVIIGTAPTPELAATTALTLHLANAR